jgi:DNA-binding IclR family transcriptional regulator
MSVRTARATGTTGAKARKTAPSPTEATVPASPDAARMPGKIVGAVDGAIRILRHLSRLSEPAGVSRIAKETGLNTSTAFNILRTLALHDFVLFDPQSKTYALSLGIMEVARGATALGGEIDTLRPLLERIANQHGVTVTLWQPVSRNRKVLVLSALSRNAMRIQMAVGQRLPILTGATGRVFAAFGTFKDGDLKACFDEIRWDQPLAFRDFQRQVKATREQGWSLDDGNFASGTISLAVPIYGRDEAATMSVTVTMFTGQYSTEKSEEIIRDLRAFAEHAARVIDS